ncbi:GspH/FimT family protein [Nevskia sp.]|uniref:GspH/FimT family pseudopilin n=1 Tax=Nevskia sp. TaxID=1929292 RepID=UPI0025F826F8|nr:GspH/FimT family protein [Nevskia sp.]
MSDQKGFTLLEMMVVIAIAAVLLAIASPGLRSFVLAGSRGDAASGLYGAMVRARAEAIARNTPVTLCQRDYNASGGHARCDASATGSWVNGWVIYRDSAPDDSGAKPATADDVIATGEPADRAFAWAGDPADTAAVQFESSGRLSSSSRISFRLCKQGDSAWEGRRVQIDTSGRIRLAKDSGCNA